MHDETYEPVEPNLARNQYAALFRKTGATDADKQAALAKLATAKIDKAIREAVATLDGARLHHAQVEYLTSLIANRGERK